MNGDDFIRKMPKVELHLHLEGSVLPETLFQLARKNGVTLPVDNGKQLAEWFLFKDFDHFLSIYFAISECIGTCDDIEYITRAMLREQARQNILYSEVTFTPYTHLKQKGLPIPDQIAALSAGKREAEEEFGVTCNFICDISREVTPGEGLVTVDGILESGSDDVIALGMGGPEAAFLPSRHQEAFNRAHANGLPVVVHAGETAGPESIRDALNAAGSVRIGHGVRAVEDPLLMDYLRESGIVLEVCPSSNICLGVFPDMKSHSLPLLLGHGCRITINSDDPPMFGTSLTREYEILSDTFGYGAEEFFDFNMNAIEGSLLSPDRKESLKKTFNEKWKNCLK